MSYILLYTDRENQQREAGPESQEALRALFVRCGALKGEIYNARSLAMYHAGVRRYAPVVIEQLWGSA